MSPRSDKTVPQLVEKYREKYPNLDRDLLRKLIRLENNITNPSELKKLDRYLRKAFGDKAKKFEENLNIKDRIRLLELAAELSKTNSPLIVRDVYLRMGNKKLKIEHE